MLIVLDLCGTLLSRVNTRELRERCIRSEYCPALPNFSLGRPAGSIYLRPHISVFLDFLFKHFYVATWSTTSTRTNCELVEHVFGNRKDELIFSFDRFDLRTGNASSRGDFGTKDLNLLWALKEAYDDLNRGDSDDECDEGRHGSGLSPGSHHYDGDVEIVDFKLHNNEQASNARIISKSRKVVGRMSWLPSNTILIDDSPGKATCCLNNYVGIPEYKVWDNEYDPKYDTALLSLMMYLLRLHEAYPIDVRDWIKDTKLYDYSLSSNTVSRSSLNPGFAVPSRHGFRPEPPRQKVSRLKSSTKSFANDRRNFDASPSSPVKWGSEDEA